MIAFREWFWSDPRHYATAFVLAVIVTPFIVTALAQWLGKRKEREK